jgi:hypothetical protein
MAVAPVLLLDQGGLGAEAADVCSGASLTCKDSLLVSWGGATDVDNTSCPVLAASGPGSVLQLQKCTLQLHPDSVHPEPAMIFYARDYASVTASGCKLVGPAPGSTSEITSAAGAEAHATVVLVSATMFRMSQCESQQTDTQMPSPQINDLFRHCQAPLTMAEHRAALSAACNT